MFSILIAILCTEKEEEEEKDDNWTYNQDQYYKADPWMKYFTFFPKNSKKITRKNNFQTCSKLWRKKVFLQENTKLILILECAEIQKSAKSHSLPGNFCVCVCAKRKRNEIQSILMNTNANTEEI